MESSFQNVVMKTTLTEKRQIRLTSGIVPDAVDEDASYSVNSVGKLFAIS
ncbi:hypothetical protein Pan14r_01180 [Crateriforma conspicua]|uniref:Uncharacterized protein n=1 Tax=Crateriforma conspicua TaxID=2527996 RepID=A0A5C5XY43_9PLAN|nr:hypothetical protein Mal65_24890 [Crateriforma conspicua]TWT67880.1 hypothetical protein Pan14r_01180 [Crateriforma conspicua]